MVMRLQTRFVFSIHSGFMAASIATETHLATFHQNMGHALKLIGSAVIFLAGFRVGRNLSGEAQAVTVCHQVAAVRPQTAAQAELAMVRREQMTLRETDLIGAAVAMAP